MYFDKNMEQWYPDEKEPKQIGVCEHCNIAIYENEEYIVSQHHISEIFCCIECVLQYYNLKGVN